MSPSIQRFLLLAGVFLFSGACIFGGAAVGILLGTLTGLPFAGLLGALGGMLGGTAAALLGVAVGGVVLTRRLLAAWDPVFIAQDMVGKPWGMLGRQYHSPAADAYLRITPGRFGALTLELQHRVPTTRTIALSPPGVVTPALQQSAPTPQLAGPDADWGQQQLTDPAFSEPLNALLYAPGRLHQAQVRTSAEGWIYWRQSGAALGGFYLPGAEEVADWLDALARLAEADQSG